VAVVDELAEKISLQVVKQCDFLEDDIEHVVVSLIHQEIN
jgi:hypothetical protein